MVCDTLSLDTLCTIKQICTDTIHRLIPPTLASYVKNVCKKGFKYIPCLQELRVSAPIP